MTLLHVDSSILGAYSVSRQLSADIVAKLTAGKPDIVVTYRDLAAEPIAHLSGPAIAALRTADAQPDAPLAADLADGATALQAFLAADTIVVGVAFYNFSIPSQLKAWIDRLLVAGQTFRYGADGRPEGLAGDKRVILAVARGGRYGEGSPFAPFEHAETYLRAVFGFMGITEVEVIVAEGVASGPEHRAAAIASAEREIAALAA